MGSTLATAEPGTRARDPVCGMILDVGPDAAPVLHETWGGQTYAFCSEACREAFRADPSRHPPRRLDRGRWALTLRDDASGARLLTIPIVLGGAEASHEAHH